MKSIYKLLILTALLAILLLIAWETRAQDTTRTPIGYDIDQPHLYARVDTIHGITQLYNYYPCKMYFSINGGKAQLIERHQVFTVWGTHFAVVVTRKKYRHEYKFYIMAYFSNGSEGHVFDDQCAKCKYGKHPCPIAFVQMEFNYDQHKDTTGTAEKLLNHLVKDDGTCTMWDTFKSDLEIDPNQLSLFN